MKPSSIASMASSFFILLLLPLVSAEALPALDPCWRQCITHQLPCADNDWPCFCRTARQTSLFLDTIACIRQTCTANRPFNPTTLLTPFTEKCKKPIAADILANAQALAAQDPTSPLASTSPGSPGDITANAPAFIAAAATTRGRANVITTTYIGLAANAKGQQETFTVPALLGLTGTIYGSPITKIEGTATPTSIVTLPWPTLPVGYFFSPSGATPGTDSAGKAVATANIVGGGVTTMTSVVAAKTSDGGIRAGRDGVGGE
ncbi:MAG: hypothetical protein L6R40_006151 [Gallowayella cf. fulva]|nr:MAG: hypothetical protein L6R40_006151 [Xanthomendoza cf. fulva]